MDFWPSLNRASYEVVRPLILAVRPSFVLRCERILNLKALERHRFGVLAFFTRKYRWNGNYPTLKSLMVIRLTSRFDQTQPDVSLLLCMINIFEDVQRYQLIDLVERTHTFVAPFFRNRAKAQQIHVLLVREFSLLTPARIGNLVHDCKHPTSLTFPPHHLTIPTLQKTDERTYGQGRMSS